MKPAGGMWGDQRVWGAGSREWGLPTPREAASPPGLGPARGRHFALYLTTCLVKFNGLVIPGK